MNCKKIQELLMTDYIDGELNEKMQASILEHLATCDRCKRFEENLKEKVINPLKSVEKQYPPYFVWENIKNRIIKDRQSVSEKIDIVVTSKLSSIFKTLKPAFAVPAIAIAKELRLTPGAVSHRMQQIQQQIDELEDLGGL